MRLAELDALLRFPPMSREEERQTAETLRLNLPYARVDPVARRLSDEARERMVLSNMRFVVRLALPFRNGRVELSELMNVAVIRMMRLAERFDPSRGFRFLTFAERGIRGAMRGFVRRSREVDMARLAGMAAERVAVDGETRAARIEAIWQIARRLDVRSQAILLERYRKGDTLDAVGARHGLSGERVRKIEAKALECIRAALLKT